MEFMECLQTRRSIRKFMQREVPREVIERIVKAASYAPSWKNTQAVRYTVITNRELLTQITEECVLGFRLNMDTIAAAPALVLVTTIPGRSGYERDGSVSTSKGDRWEMFDAGIAVQTFCLAAHEMGLGTVILGVFDEEKTAAAAELPEGETLAAMIAIGYPDQTPQMPRRKEVSELLRFR